MLACGFANRGKPLKMYLFQKGSSEFLIESITNCLMGKAIKFGSPLLNITEFILKESLKKIHGRIKKVIIIKIFILFFIKYFFKLPIKNIEEIAIFRNILILIKD